jgi:response regulator RpfG family c-di-GMP phosphodiesterase
MESPKLLLVQADKMAANYLARRFSEVTELRFDVGVTFSGEDAIKMVTSSSFDIVLVDVQLPGISGIETLKEINQVDADMQTILMGEDLSPEVLITGFREGAYDFVLTPFEFDELLETIKNALEKRERLTERRRLIRNLSEANDRLTHDNQMLLESRGKAEEELGRLRRQMRAFTAYLERSNMGNDLSQCAELVVRSAVEILDRKEVAILFVEEDRLVVRDVSVFEQQFYKGEGVPLPQFDVFLRESDRAKVLEYKSASGIRALACVRLSSGGDPVGVLCAGLGDRERPFDESDLVSLTEFGGCASASLRGAFLLDQVQKTYLEGILSLLVAAEIKDPDIRVHSQRVADYSLKIARELRLSERESLMIKYAALLHDLGKIGIKDELLKKGGGLSADEIEEIRQHEILSDRIVAPMKFLAQTRPMIRHHHERFDGKGYPEGLKGEDIPLGARVIAAADSFDALTSTRSYHDRLTKDEAVLKMEADAGWLDPRILEAFKRVLEKEGELGWKEER